MSLSTVLDKLEIIASHPGKIDKRNLLKNYLEDPLFSKTVQLMLSETKRFKILDLPKVSSSFQTQSADVIFAALEKLAKKKGATDKDKFSLAEYVGSGRTREVVLRILEGKTKAGFGLTSVIRVAPDLMFKTPYQRCSGIKNLHRVSFPALAQKKADGMFSYASPWLKNELFDKPFLTRSGKSFDLLGELEEELNYRAEQIRKYWVDPILVGEFNVLEEDGGVMPRAKGNGVINSFIKGEGDPELAKRVIYSVWDVLPAEHFLKKECLRSYGERWSTLERVFKSHFKEGKIQLIESKIVNSLQEAQKFFLDMRKAGWEGAILKDQHSTWKNNTCPTMVKMKQFFEAEFKVVGVQEGKGKFKGMMGALQVETEDGIIFVGVGTGFPDNLRGLDYWNGHIGDIVTVQYEMVSMDKKTKKKSLSTTSFKETRFNEKTVADTAEYVEELCKTKI